MPCPMPLPMPCLMPRPIPECRDCGCRRGCGRDKYCPQEITIKVLGVDNCGNLQLCAQYDKPCWVNGQWVNCKRFH